MNLIIASRRAHIAVRIFLNVLAIASCRASQQPTLAITHASVIDVERGLVVPDQTVTVAGTRIISVRPSSSARVPAGVHTVDARGGFLMPGLWDMHAHLDITERESLGAFLAAGVTGVRDMGSNAATLRGWRDNIAIGRMAGPRMRMAGTILESAGWLRGLLQILDDFASEETKARIAARIGVSTPDDAAHAVDSVVALGGDFIKVRTEPNAPTLFAILRAAKAHGLRVSGHAPTHVPLGVASDSGFASFEHSFFGVMDSRGGLELDSVKPDDRKALFQRFRRNGTMVTPTLVTMQSYRLLPDSVVRATMTRMFAEGTAAPSCLSPRLRAHWREQMDLKRFEGSVDWKADERSRMRDLREMHAEGVAMLAGTDAGVVLLIPGFSLQDELSALVTDAGLTPLEALRTATLNPAVFMRATDSLGTIAEGKLADLVLLEANPLADIANVRGVRMVVANGRPFTSSELDTMPGVAQCRSLARSINH